MTATLRHADTDADIRACFAVMQTLRPHLADPDELLARVRRQATESYRILAAWEAGGVVGLAGYRWQENLVRGPFCYVDDLVVGTATRRGGLGARLLDGVAAEARSRGVPQLVLDTAIGNSLGQRFYFRYGMLPTALHFTKPVAEVSR